MRHVGLFIARIVFGGYLFVHGTQKLFGWFGGSGLAATGAGFEKRGMRPGKAMAALAGISEAGGGLLTATGVADPLGPLIIATTMAVASTTHREQGPLARDRGYELPLTNLVMALALMSAGTGVLRLGPHLPKSLTRKAMLGGAVLASIAIAQQLSEAKKQAGLAAAPVESTVAESAS
ncbi:MAG: DoxX family protein [Acidimicrobiales bacterium]|jgi:putative oxidoreductase